MKVLIADDESTVLVGLKYIIDWASLGFSICGLAGNGQEALELILSKQPELVLLDIRMPKLSGTEIVQIAREKGFQGHFIILSGYSDFSYAQTAIRYGVDFYLTKPLDEDELENAVTTVKNQIIEERRSAQMLTQYRSNARLTVLQNLLLGNFRDITELNLEDFQLSSDEYQVVLYERFLKDPFQNSWDFAELLRLMNYEQNSFDHITIDNREVILLKGSFALSRFERLLSHYEINPQKGSPLDSLFLVYGRRVNHPEEIMLSYFDASALLDRRFFCTHKQHVLGCEVLPADSELTFFLTDDQSERYASRLLNYIQSQNYHEIAQTFAALSNDLYHCAEDISAIRHFLIDIFMQIRQRIPQLYKEVEIPFSTNSAIINAIEGKPYLHEILNMLNEQFEMYTNAICPPTSESVIDDILHYINHNFADNLKLESIAALFGYNSAYLGKIFTKKVGESFNSYLDRVRVEQAKQLLQEADLKVYEVAEKVGYKNVDYFHKKFKKYCEMSPAEFRKTL